MKWVIQLIGGLTVGLAIMTAIAAWRLSSGPISVGFLTPYIEQALSVPHRGLQIKLNETILTWAGWERALDIRVIGVRAMGPDGREIAEVPELSLSLSARALAQGMIAPKNIEMFGPSLRLVRTEGGRFELGFAGTEGQTGAMFTRLLSELSARPDPDRPMSYLSRFSIFAADLVLEDRTLGVSWEAPNAELMLMRNAEGVHGEMSLALETGGAPADVSIIGSYKADARMLDVGVSFDDITPAVFSEISPAFEALNTIEMPLQGTVTLSVNGEGGVESVGFDISGGAGHMAFPVGLAQKLGLLPLAQRLAVDEVALRGRFEGAQGARASRTEITRFSLTLADGEKIYLPAPLDHELPLKAIKGSGRYLSGQSRAEVVIEAADLAGPRLSFSGEFDRIGWSDASISGEGVIHDVPADDVGLYWPATLAGDARTWITGNMKQGRVSEAHARFRFAKTETGGYETRLMEGGMVMEDMVVDYYSPLPPVEKVSATAIFDANRFDISVSRGESEGLTVTGGTVSFSELEKSNPLAAIDLSIEGPFKNSLELIDKKPLGLVAGLGIDPAQTEGTASTRLNLAFRLKHDMDPNEIKVSAVSDLDGVTIRSILFERDLTEGRLSLAVDRRGMDIIGEARLGSIPTRISWRENFAGEALFKSRYDISAHIEDIRNMGDLGIDLTSVPWEYIDGALEADVSYTVLGENQSELKARLDVGEVALAIPPLDWSKARGVAGLVEMTLNLAGNRLVGVPRFTVMAGDMEISGSATYGAEDGSLSRVDLERVAFGRTDVAGVLFPRAAGGWNANMHGDSFDFVPLWEHFLARDEGASEETDGGGGIPFSVSVDLDGVWVKDKGRLTEVSGTFTHDGRQWSRIVMNSRVGKAGALDLTLAAGASGDRELLMTSNDAGEALRVFGIYPNMVGGTLVLDGRYDDAKPTSPLKGRLQVQDFRVINAPALVRLITVMALTGILDALQGDGLAFAELDIPYALSQGTLEITAAKATGASLGLTAEGSVYTQSDIVSLQGTVVPAYALNSLLGNIPLLGTLLTGTEEGGGMFAATYSVTGSLEKPEITVNPLSVLAPGILRNLFGLIGSGDAPEPAPESAKEEEKVRGPGSRPPPPSAAPTEPVTPAPSSN